MSADLTPADLRHVETWLFDLDNTLYPAECEFMALVEGRMTEFVARETGLPKPQALALQKKYLHEHGTTLAGLMTVHGVDPERFLEEVHDVSLDRIQPDAALVEGLERLPGRRLVFTNGSASHAERILAHLGVDHLFADVFHIAAADYVPKPSPATFERLIERHAVPPRETAFFEDSERNLRPAAELGMTTVLVGAHAADSSAEFVHYRTHDLPGFLASAKVRSQDA